MSDEIALSVRLEIAPGVFLELEDEAGGYSIGRAAFADRTKSRKQKTVGADMAWLRGELVTASAPGNVTETLEVWVVGATHFEFDTRLKVVEDALTEQMSYRLVRTIDDSRQTWSCQPCSQLRVVTQAEYIWATSGMISAQLPRLPDVLLEHA